MFKKTFYGARIAPECAFCEYATPTNGGKMILCRRKGVVSPHFACRRFRYDPLQRVPHRQVLPDLDPRDFTLE